MAEVTVSWNELTERGRIASEKLDTGRWEIGDLACDVEKEYGTDRIADFSREIGQNKETVKGYRRTARAFPKSVRAKLFDEYPNLFYSHYRTAARLDSPHEQIAFLEETSSNGWTTDEAAYQMAERSGGKHKTDKPTIWLDGVPCVVKMCKVGKHGDVSLILSLERPVALPLTAMQITLVEQMKAPSSELSAA